MGNLALFKSFPSRKAPEFDLITTKTARQLTRKALVLLTYVQ